MKSQIWCLSIAYYAWSLPKLLFVLLASTCTWLARLSWSSSLLHTKAVGHFWAPLLSVSHTTILCMLLIVFCDRAFILYVWKPLFTEINGSKETEEQIYTRTRKKSYIALKDSCNWYFDTAFYRWRMKYIHYVICIHRFHIKKNCH